MSGFEEKLNAILSDPDAMGQIMELARSLGRDGDHGAPSASDGRENSGAPPAPSAPDGPRSDSPLSGLDSLDPRLLNMALRLLSVYRAHDDDRAALLTALRPFVKPERYAKLDQAIRISRLTRVIRAALDSFRGSGEEDSHV